MKNENSLLARAAVGLGLALWRTPQARTAIGQVYKGAKDIANALTSSNTQSSNTGTTTGKMGTNDGSPNGSYGGSFGGSPSSPGTQQDEEYKGKTLRDILTLKED